MIARDADVRERELHGKVVACEQAEAEKERERKAEELFGEGEPAGVPSNA